MSTPLNLTLKRGPSVWDDRPVSPTKNWRAFGVAAGAVLASLALRPHANRRWLIGVGLGVAGACLLGDRFASTTSAGMRRIFTGVRNDAVDRASEDSFPASDPTPYL
jgi:hypothetical protein